MSEQDEKARMNVGGVQYYKSVIRGEDFVVDERYQDLECVGGGSYGLVCKAKDTKLDRDVAIKKITNTFANLTDAKRILREIKLLKHFNHDNVIEIFDIMTIPADTVDFEDIYIVNGLMETDLERIIRSNQAMTEQHFQYFVYQILLGLKYIHTANVLHRDMKPSNLLVNKNCDLKICDLGLARGVEDDPEEDAALTEYVVTRWYRAPELLAGNESYGAGVDVWALGCIFAELLNGRPFFPGRDPKHQLDVILQKIGSPEDEDLGFITSAAVRRAVMEIGKKPKVPWKTHFPDASDNALDLLEKLLVFSPEKRITVQEALDHAFMKELRGVDDDPSCPTVFDFDFEKDYCASGQEIPKDKLQALMYSERLAMRPLDESIFAAKRSRLIEITAPYTPASETPLANSAAPATDADGSAPKKQKTGE